MAINRWSVIWEGAFAALVKAIKKWEPGVTGNEADYQDDLAEHLRAISNDARVEREYRHLGSKIDIYFRASGLVSRDEVFIETKLNLTTENEYKRLVGQIETMEPQRHSIIILLLGKTRPEFVERLREKYRNLWLHLAILEKPVQDPVLALGKSRSRN